MIDMVLVPLIVVGLLLNGLRLRARVPAALPLTNETVPPSGGAAPTRGAAHGGGGGDGGGAAHEEGAAHEGGAAGTGGWVTSRGTTVDEATRCCAADHAVAGALDLVDVVPADLPATAARDLVRVIDAKSFRASRLVPARSAGAAVFLSTGLVSRAGVTETDLGSGAGEPSAGTETADGTGLISQDDVTKADQPSAADDPSADLRSAGGYRTADAKTGDDEAASTRAGAQGLACPPGPADRGNALGIERSGREAADVIALVRRLRPYAAGADVRVAPGVRAGEDDLAKRRARLRANGASVPLHVALEVIPWVLTLVALAAAWPWGLVALVAFSAQPYLVFGGTALKPRGLHTAALLRMVHDPYVWVRTAAGRWRSPAEVAHDAASEAAVPWYRAEVARGTARFFEPRRETCPWCGSGELAVSLRSTDLVMGKPGAFILEKCGGCGHVFQNPRLTPAGLDFYYRDAYDGLGTGLAELIFATGTATYRDRARMTAAVTTPKSWLDVGAGHAHFCVVAREVLPDTVFDGLDQGAGIEEAERRGWVTTAHRGMFPDLAAELAGRYDVVSMHHYLEHTRDPFAELDAAARVLPAGGYLLIELPDPQWRLAPLFGRYWMPWFQPQHQHMMPIGNLTTALADRGLRTVATERGVAHQANDLVIAAYLFFARIAPERNTPWSARPPTPAYRVWRGLAWTVGVPVMAIGLLIDQTLIRALAKRWDLGNAYRVLARKEGPADAG